jgi:hypothetical protein
MAATVPRSITCKSSTICSAAGTWRWRFTIGAKARSVARSPRIRDGLAIDYQSLTCRRNALLHPKPQAEEHHRNPAQYGIELAGANQLFVAVPPTRISMSNSRPSSPDVPLQEFMSLNPRTPARHPSRWRIQFVAAADKADSAPIRENSQPLVSWQTYTLKSGDTISRVATRHGTSVAQLKQINDRAATSASARLGRRWFLRADAQPRLPDLRSRLVATAKVTNKPHAASVAKSGMIKRRTRKTRRKTLRENRRSQHQKNRPGAKTALI